MNNSYILVDDKAFVATNDGEMVVRDAFVDMKEILELENKIELLEGLLIKKINRLEDYENLKKSGIKTIKGFMAVVLAVSCSLPFVLSGMVRLFGVVLSLAEFIPVTIGLFFLFTIPSSLVLVPEVNRINKNIAGLKYVVESLTKELAVEKIKLEDLNKTAKKCSYQEEIKQYNLDNKALKADLVKKTDLQAFFGQQENKIKRKELQGVLEEYLTACGVVDDSDIEQIYTFLQSESEEEMIEQNKTLLKKY